MGPSQCRLVRKCDPQSRDLTQIPNDKLNGTNSLEIVWSRNIQSEHFCMLLCDIFDNRFNNSATSS